MVTANGGVTVMARLRGVAGAYVTQASLSSISWKCTRTADDDTETVTGSGTLTISSVIFDTLQTDARWTRDSTGYTFLAELPATAFTTGDLWHRVDVLFTGVSGQPFVQSYRFRPIKTAV